MHVFEYETVREDPRWRELLAEVGISPEELSAIEFDVTLPE